MPTDLCGLVACKTAIKSRGQADVTVLLITVILCLINVALILLSPTFAEAVALVGRF